jgi:hypothetical protein
MNYEEYEDEYSDYYEDDYGLEEAIIETALEIYDEYEVTMEEAIDIAMESDKSNENYDLFKDLVQTGGAIGGGIGYGISKNTIGEGRRKKVIDRGIRKMAEDDSVDLGNGVHVYNLKDTYKKYGVDPKTRKRDESKATATHMEQGNFDKYVRASDKVKAYTGLRGYNAGEKIGSVAAAVGIGAAAYNHYKNKAILAAEREIIKNGREVLRLPNLDEATAIKLRVAIIEASSLSSSKTVRLKNLKLIDRISHKVLKDAKRTAKLQAKRKSKQS